MADETKKEKDPKQKDTDKNPVSGFRKKWKDLTSFQKFAYIYLFMCLVILFNVAAMDAYVSVGIDPEKQEYAQFKKSVEDGDVYGVYLSTTEDRALYQLRSDLDTDLLEEEPSEISVGMLPRGSWQYVNYQDYDAFRQMLTEHDLVIVSGAFDQMLPTVSSFILSISISVFMMYFMFQIFSNAMPGMSSKQTKYEMDKDTGVHFSDVIGHDEVIADIRSYLSILKESERFKGSKVKPPRGILFTGMPGTGKTLLAKAMAGEAGVPFIYLNTTNAIEMYVGVGAKTIRQTFKKARESAPCIVFLDEIDAIGRSRGSMVQGTSEDTQTLLALLQELDGFSAAEGILVIAATNKPDSLDEALLRSGRFDREIQINPPKDASVREEMLKFYTKDYQLDKSVDLKAFSKQMAGMTGADVANVCNEAGVIALMSNDGKLPDITMDMLTEALDKILLKGNKLSDKHKANKRDRKVVAYHEAGHAVMSYLNGEEIGRVSTAGTTSGVGGFVQTAEKDTRFLSLYDLESQVLTAYAGRCSEIIKFGPDWVTTGSSNDIEQATKLLSAMCLKYGMSDEIGPVSYEVLFKQHMADPEGFQKHIVKAAREYQQEAMDRLKENYQLVEALAEALLEQETMAGKDVQKLLEKAR